MGGATRDYSVQILSVSRMHVPNVQYKVMQLREIENLQ